MNVTVKHDAPLGCKIRSKLFYSPSRVLINCNLGVSRCKKCKGCECNVHEILNEMYKNLKGGWLND